MMTMSLPPSSSNVPTSVRELATALGVTAEAIRKKLNRMSISITGEKLTPEELSIILQEYAQPHGRRPPETTLAAQRIATDAGIELSGTAPSLEPAPESPKPAPAPEPLKPAPAPEPLKPAPAPPRPTPAPEPAPAPAPKVVHNSWIDKIFQSRAMLFVVFLAGMMWQIAHTAVVVARADKTQVTDASIQDYLYALAIQFTALLMTVHKGGRYYLISFGVFEFFVNMAYYRPWAQEATKYAIDVWAVDILLSMGIAFSLFSYSELMADKN